MSTVLALLKCCTTGGDNAECEVHRDASSVEVQHVSAGHCDSHCVHPGALDLAHRGDPLHPGNMAVS